MNYKELKFKIKSIPVIGRTYQFLIGNKKIERKRKNAQIYLRQTGTELIQQLELALKSYSDDLVFFADYGTLLGAIRDHGFISWDLDIDYGVITPVDFDKAQLEKHLLNYDFHKIREFQYLGEIKEQTYTYKNLGIDLFYKTDDGVHSVAYGFYKKPNFRYHLSTDHHVRKVEYISVAGTCEIPFLGAKITVPANAEAYLESVYSKNWKIPDPEWDDNKETPDRKTCELAELGSGWFKE